MTLKLQQLYSKLRQAIDKYNMIEDGDRIAVGISGGKDSLTLLYGLAGLRMFYPKKFEIIGITVDLGYDNFETARIKNICDELCIEYVVINTEISKMSAEGGCSLCARLRKGALMECALEHKCNKIAYAHNMDDVVETMMLSLIYEGRFSSFWPVTYYEDNKITLIRPLVFIPKADVVGFCNKNSIIPVKNPCPFDKTTNRTYVRELLHEMESHAPGVKKRMMTAISEGNANWKVH